MRDIIRFISKEIKYKEHNKTDEVVLIEWLQEIKTEIKINEGCNIRTEENEAELKDLYYMKNLLKQKIKKLEELENEQNGI